MKVTEPSVGLIMVMVLRGVSRFDLSFTLSVIENNGAKAKDIQGGLVVLRGLDSEIIEPFFL
ncbi:hypothetical protein A1QC_05830 [Vibrio rumoiensis 1S-45]|uniref:Uncharacterized protein n=1 Tax=Vibrio rumoiensis 1S-45 TaxID=1188252 RepID=A0A1E5E520_9VIBR|nr:hypothetical protein A1QC_05830 [Vibrio rumoiensis 1S-45]